MASPFDAVRTGGDAPRRLPAVAPRPPLGLTVRPRSDLRAVPLEARIAPRNRKKDDGEKRSILGQFKDAAFGIGPGVFGLARSAATSAIAPVRAALDYKDGEISGTGALWRALPGSGGIDAGLGFFGNDAAAERSAKYNPLGTEFGQSAKNTLGNIRNPSRYKDAWDEGRIVGTVLEDAGNVALVGGAASKALGTAGRSAGAAGNTVRAAQFERASGIANRIARPLDAVADSPISVPRRAIVGARRVGVGAIADAKAGRFGARANAVAENVSRRAPILTSEVGTMLKREGRNVQRSARRAETAAHRSILRASSENGLTLAEEGVGTAVRTGLADQLRTLVDDQGLSLEQARQLITRKDIPEQTFTADVAQAAYDYVTGNMDPERAAAIGRYTDAIDKVITERQTGPALAGVGRPSGPLPVEQTLNDAIPANVETAVQEAGFDMATVPPDVLDAILDDPSMYPRRWRPAMKAALRARAEGPQVPVRPADMLAAGLPEPGYLTGGRSDLADPRRFGSGRVPIREGLNPVAGMRSEKRSLTSEVLPFSARTIAEQVGKEVRTAKLNAGIEDIFIKGDVPTVADVIPSQRLAAIKAEADAIANDRVGRAPEAIAQRTAQAYGELVARELEEVHGYEPLIGDRAQLQVGDYAPDAKVEYTQIKDNTVVLPGGLKERLTPHMRGKDMGKFFSMVAKMNSKFKGLVLPFSVRWQLGDLIGGAYMAWSGGGVPPWQLIDGMRKAKNLDAAGREAIFDNPDYQDASLNIDERNMMNATAPTEAPTTKLGKAWRRGGDVRRASFRLNAAINRVNRQGFVLAKVQDLLDVEGLSLDDVSANAKWDDPKVQKAITEAIDDANEVMGTFDEMTPFERNVVTGIFPFYAWNRHVTMLAWRTAIDHPSRAMWTLRLGAYGHDEVIGDAELLPWQEGSIPVGDTLIPTNFVSPFNDIAGGSLLSPAGAARSLSPALKALSVGVLNRDPNRNMERVTRPFDGLGLDSLGREGGMRLNIPLPGVDSILGIPNDPSAGAYTVLRQFPQTRELMNVLPTGEVGRLGLGPHPRYGTGEFMVDRRGNPIDTDSRVQSLFGLLGLRGSGDTPLLGSTEDNTEIIATRDRRRAEAARRASNTVRFGGN